MKIQNIFLHFWKLRILYEERKGSVVEELDKRSSLCWLTLLTLYPSLVLFQPRKSGKHPDMTPKLLPGMKESTQTKQRIFKLQPSKYCYIYKV